jgi:hypothetical protein
MPVINKIVQPPRIILGESAPKDPLPIKPKMARNVYIHFEYILLWSKKHNLHNNMRSTKDREKTQEMDY